MKTLALNLTPNAALVKTSLQNGIMLYNPVLRTAHVFNETATLFWNVLAEEKDIELIFAKFLGRFGNAAVEDFENLYVHMEELGLLILGDDESKQDSSQNVPIVEDMIYVKPFIETYSEEVLKKYLEDDSFATFHDDTFSDIGGSDGTGVA